ncbi:MAG TPA: oligosaccharide flippase family protein [Gemmatimonadaceae bacterium]|nr:oligosaccharide flippase family protein [Gemmatimonadaceae bacterium]
MTPRRLTLVAMHVRQRVRAARSSTYARNVGSLLVGSTVSQLLPIALAPVMTRLYAPADYGALAICMSVSGIVSVLVTSQYTQAILLPRRRAEAVNLLAVSTAASLLIAAMLGIALVVARQGVARLIGDATGTPWLLAVPPVVFCNGLIAALTLWLTREREFGTLSATRITQAAATSALQLGVGFTVGGPIGLIGAYLAGSVIGAAILVVRFWNRDRRYLRLLSLHRSSRLVRVQANFLFYVLPADLLNTVTNQWPTLLLMKLVGAASTGFYSLTQRVISLPMGFVGSSVFEVFRQRAVAEYHERGNCRAAFVSTFRILALLGIGPTLVILFLGPQLFSLIFGAEWGLAGEYARALSVLMFLRFVVSPLTYVYYIAGRQREDLVLHIVMIVTTVLAMWGGYRLFRSGLGAVSMFAANYSAIYVLYLVRSYQLAGGDRRTLRAPGLLTKEVPPGLRTVP